MTAGSSSDGQRCQVWDPVVRTTHWLVALGCFVNLSVLRHADEPHEWLGYAVTAAVLVRILWGLVAPGHANFRDFVPTPRSFASYFKLLLRRREPRYVGHNPAGAAMMLSLMALVLICGISGWMMGLDAFWGDSTLEAIHVTSANLILGLSILHVGGAVVESVRHRENLILSMITGYKRAPTGSDVCHVGRRASAEESGRRPSRPAR